MEVILLSVLIFVMALFYSSVGHGGASGYLAAMAIFGLAPIMMKITSLSLNVLVSGIAAWGFYRAKYFNWRIFIPLILASAPFAYLGGAITVHNHLYKWIVGIFLLYSSFRLYQVQTKQDQMIRRMNLPLAILIGAGIGFLSGLVGVGGGIFLSPILLLLRWTDPKETAGISAMFILFNSIFGILGNRSGLTYLPDQFVVLALCAVLGGWIGSYIGSKKANNQMIRRLLVIVLSIAGIKMLLM